MQQTFMERYHAAPADGMYLFTYKFYRTEPTHPFRVGDHVLYRHVDSNRTRWYGIVIPRPAGYEAVGERGTFVWVLKGSELRGCYPWNLEKV